MLWYIIATIVFLTVLGSMAILRNEYGVPELVERIVDIAVGIQIFTWAEKSNK